MAYGKIHGSFWSDDKIVGLPDDAKLLAVYLITGPHRSIIGAFRLPLGYMATDLRWEMPRCAGALRELERIGFIWRDGDWVHVRNQVLYDPPQNPNQVKAAVRQAQQISSPTIQESVRERSITHLRFHGQGYHSQFDCLPDRSETVSQPFANQFETPGPGPGPGPHLNQTESLSGTPMVNGEKSHVNGSSERNPLDLESARPSPAGASAKVMPAARH